MKSMESKKRFNAGYYISEGMASIFKHGFMSFASVCIIVACLIIMGSFALLSVNVSKIINDFESENAMLAYVLDGYPEEQARELGRAIDAIPNVAHSEFVSREEAMNSYISGFTEQDRFENVPSSTFRHRFIVYIDDIAHMADTQRAVSEVPGIAWVNAHLQIARGFVVVRNIVSGVSFVIIAVLLTVSLFIMSNTIKLAMFERREEIAVMRMVGATSGFIRWPFVFEGFILGFFGALLAFLAQWSLYRAVTSVLVGSQLAGFISAVPFSQLSVLLCLLFLIIGLGVGALGSATAIRKYLKI